MESRSVRREHIQDDLIKFSTLSLPSKLKFRATWTVSIRIALVIGKTERI